MDRWRMVLLRSSTIEGSGGQVIDMVEDEAVATAAAAATPVDPDVAIVADPDAAKLPANAVLQPDGSVKLTFVYPVTFRWKNSQDVVTRTDSYPELLMRRLTGADMRAIESASKGHYVTTGLAKSCRMEQGKFNLLYDRMDAIDTNAAAEVLGFFMGVGQKTGA